MIGNLFAVLHQGPYVLPDVVNQPTQARLEEVITQQLGLSKEIIKVYTVRKVVEEICRFSSSRTLCWDLLGQASHSGAESGDRLRRGLQQSGALQRVFALCAEPVVEKVEMVIQQHPELIEGSAGEGARVVRI